MAKIEHLQARSTTFTPEMALADAAHTKLKDVVVLGFDEDGDFIVRVSGMTNERGVYLCLLGVDHCKGSLK